jgi:polyphosphate glucokinase
VPAAAPPRRSPAPARGRTARPAPAGPSTLALDVGGTALKATVLDAAGQFLVERVRVSTPVGRPPRVLVETVAALTRGLPRYDRIAAGFPGTVADGRVLTAPNLGHAGWLGFPLARALAARLRRPARVANDVALQGLGAIRGQGVELVVTLGTGFGSALYLDGLLVPQFAVCQHLLRDGTTYDDELNQAALEQVGVRRWNARLREAIETLRALVYYDHLLIGGGNAERIDFAPGPRVTIISNDGALRGGLALWVGAGLSPAPRGPADAPAEGVGGTPPGAGRAARRLAGGTRQTVRAATPWRTRPPGRRRPR